MKLKVVALAVLMTAGIAHAQSGVTLSGKLAFAYQSSKTFGTGAKASGLAVTDGDFALTAVEDLGGGLKATAFMNVQSRGRDTNIQGRDAYLKLDGGFGSVMIGSIESANAILDLGAGGAPTIGLDNNTLDAGLGNVDMLSYTTPGFGGASFYIGLVDAAGNNGASNTLGMHSTATSTDGVKLGVNYAVGSFTLNADYFDLGPNSSGDADAKRFAVSGMYDFGAFAAGAGFQSFKEEGAARNKQYLLGISAPLTSALTVGATYGRQTEAGTATVKGYELGAHYALSKRTGVRVAYRSEKADGGIAGKDYQVRLMHTF